LFTRVPSSVGSVSPIPAAQMIEGVFDQPATATANVTVDLVDDDGNVLAPLGVVATMSVTAGQGVTATTLNSGPYFRLLALPPGRYRILLIGSCTVASAFRGWAQILMQSFTLVFPTDTE